jgi:hypothetical protein
MGHGRAVDSLRGRWMLDVKEEMRNGTCLKGKQPQTQAGRQADDDRQIQAAPHRDWIRTEHLYGTSISCIHVLHQSHFESQNSVRPSL